MPRRRILTSNLYRAARLSNNARAASRGPPGAEQSACSALAALQRRVAGLW
jgi:hypothetical protein